MKKLFIIFSILSCCKSERSNKNQILIDSLISVQKQLLLESDSLQKSKIRQQAINDSLHRILGKIIKRNASVNIEGNNNGDIVIGENITIKDN
jgi:hypothetical protein